MWNVRVHLSTAAPLMYLLILIANWNLSLSLSLSLQGQIKNPSPTAPAIFNTSGFGFCFVALECAIRVWGINTSRSVATLSLSDRYMSLAL
jgi:hypothetical protein